MRTTFLTIVLILSGVTLISCDTTRRAARRIERIAEHHPELLRADTLRIDTLLIYSAPPDTATFCIDTLPTDNTASVIITTHGTLSVQTLDARRIRVIYTPLPDTIHYRTDIVTESVRIEKPRELWRDFLLFAILSFMLCITARYFINRI